MAAFSTQTLDTQTGALPTLTAVSASDDVECPTESGQIFLYLKNTGGSADTVAITVSKTTSYGETYPAPGAPNYTLPATTGLLMIPLFPDFNNGAGRVVVTHTFTTSVTMAVVSF